MKISKINEKKLSEDLISISYDVGPDHSGYWEIDRDMLNLIRTFQESDGTYMWQPGLGLYEYNTLLGRPIKKIDKGIYLVYITKFGTKHKKRFDLIKYFR